MPDDCIFCRIVAGQIPAATVLDTPDVTAFLDINPIAAGHTLVVLKSHRPSLLHAAPGEVSALFAAARRVAGAVQSAVGADSFNIELNDGPAAGQDIPHVHVHIIPRRDADGVSGGWKHSGYDADEMSAVADRVRAGLSTEV